MAKVNIDIPPGTFRRAADVKLLMQAFQEWGEKYRELTTCAEKIKTQFHWVSRHIANDGNGCDLELLTSVLDSMPDELPKFIPSLNMMKAVSNLINSPVNKRTPEPNRNIFVRIYKFLTYWAK